METGRPKSSNSLPGGSTLKGALGNTNHKCCRNLEREIGGSWRIGGISGTQVCAEGLNWIAARGAGRSRGEEGSRE